ncbi:MAG: hypothetical protein ACLUOF_08365 [Ruminococcus sp.]
MTGEQCSPASLLKAGTQHRSKSPVSGKITLKNPPVFFAKQVLQTERKSRNMKNI